MDDSLPQDLASALVTLSSSTVSEEVLAAVNGQGGRLVTMMNQSNERQERYTAEVAERDGMIQLFGSSWP